MSSPTPAVPAMPDYAPGEGRAHDPLAVAVANASLLGVGYLMLRRRWLAFAAAAVTVVLVARLAATASASYEIAVVLWWVVMVAHGWFLARGSTGPRSPVRSRRVTAFAVTVPVLLLVGLVRFDASRIEDSVDEARKDGDCTEVSDAQDRVWFAHRIADAPSAARGDEAVEDCDRLDRARGQLAAGLTGDTDALERGFDTLASVLAEPGNEKTVETTLNGFLDGLPTGDPCDTVTVTDWLRDRKESDDVLDRSLATADRVAPAALAGCGDDLMANSSWELARTRYEQLLADYPDNDLADKARQQVTQATRHIELDNVNSLLATDGGGQPEYCSNPARYSGAKARGKGTNRALYYTSDEYGTDYSEQLPSSWKADGVGNAVLVVCMGEADYGSSVDTCPYEGASAGSTVYVTFYKIEIPVKVYEIRTGKLVSDRKIQIDGSSCPGSITYYTSGSLDTGPPSSQYVDESKSDVRDAFRPLIVR